MPAGRFRLPSTLPLTPCVRVAAIDFCLHLLWSLWAFAVAAVALVGIPPEQISQPRHVGLLHLAKRLESYFALAGDDVPDGPRMDTKLNGELAIAFAFLGPLANGACDCFTQFVQDYGLLVRWLWQFAGRDYRGSGVRSQLKSLNISS